MPYTDDIARMSTSGPQCCVNGLVGLLGLLGDGARGDFAGFGCDAGLAGEGDELAGVEEGGYADLVVCWRWFWDVVGVEGVGFVVEAAGAGHVG